MFGLPSWLVSLILKLAMQLGLPFLMEHLTWVPKEVWTFIVDALNHIQTSDDKPAAAERLRNGVGTMREMLNEAQTKGLD